MKLRYAVVHELVKESGKPIKPNHLAKSLLDVSNEVVIELVTKITELIGQRQNTANYGVFREDAARTQLPDRVIAYTRSSEKTEKEFSDLANVSMQTLHAEAAKQSLATGGYIVFADYNSSGDRFFLTAMIKQRSGITMNGLVPQSVSELELSKLHQVARISLNKLQNYLVEQDEDKKHEKTYVAFVSPKSNREAAGYFVTALGCEPGTPSAKATHSAIRGVVDFFDGNDLISQYKKEVKLELISKFREKLRHKQYVTLSDIDALVRPYLSHAGEDNLEQLSNSLSVFLQSEAYLVPSEFPVSQPAVNRYARFIYKSTEINIDIEKSAVSVSDDDPIYFDGDNGRLVISHNALIDQLRASLKDE